MTTIRAMLNMDRISKSGLYPLVIRIIHNRHKKLIYSKFRIRESEFDGETQKVIWNEDCGYSKRKAEKMNHFIILQKREIEQLIYKMERQCKSGYSADDIMLRYYKQIGDHYVFTFYEREIAAKQNSKRDGTAAIYISSRNSLKRFTGTHNITFKEITYKFVCDYIDFLRARQISDNTIHMYLRNLKTIRNKARKQGITISKYNPFDEIRTNGMPTVKRALSKETIKSIAKLDLSINKLLDQARDIFMFSFYTRGMSFVDIVFLKYSDISNGTIYYVRHKTKQNIQVAITPQLQELINKYQNDSIYILPCIKQIHSDSIYHQYRKALSSINLYLKQIGKMIGLEIPLTTYVARHSWANVAKTQGISIASISEGLGHTTESTTQIYLKAFDKSVIDKINAQVVTL